MKLLIAALLCAAELFYSPCQLHAQALNFSARIGASATSFNPRYSLASSSFGLIAGGGAEYNFTASLKGIATLDYHQLRGETHGAAITTSEYTSVTENSTTINMAELTASGAYKLPLSFLGDVAPFITAGFSAGYNFYTSNLATTRYLYPTYELRTTLSDNITSGYTRWLYSAQGGFRFEIPLTDGIFNGLLFDFRYRRNINAVTEGLTASGSNDPADKYSNSIQATIGFQF